jgi:predicted dehydrogenase
MVKLALIGTGKWGRNYINTIDKMKNCEITHIVSQTEKSLSSFSNKYNKVTNYLDLLTIKNIDGVIIATPGSTHYIIVKNLIPKYPLLVEKPLTLKLQESLLIKKLIDKNKSSLMIGHIYLHNPAYKKIKELIPTIGEIRYVSFTGYNYGPFRDDMSALWEYAPHGISIFIDIMKDVPVAISAWSINTLRPEKKLCDIVYIKCTFKNGVECIMQYGWLYPFKRTELIVYGSKQTVVMDELKEKKVSFFNSLGPDMKEGEIIEKRAGITYPQYNSKSPLEVEIDAFTGMIKQHIQPITNIDQGIAVIKVIAAAEESLNKNGKIINI